jgi:hypothetical protein
MLAVGNDTQAVLTHHVETFTAAAFGKTTMDDVLSKWSEDT